MQRTTLLLVLILAARVSADPPSAGNALQFDGVNDLVRIPNSSSLALGTQATVEAWVWLNSGTSGVRVLGKGDGQACTTERSFEIGIGLGGNGPFWSGDFFTGPTGPCHWVHVDSPQPVVTNQWVHLAMTLDTQVGIARLFVNGQAISETTTLADDVSPIVFEPVRVSSQMLYIGALAPASNTFLNGKIDEVRIWNIARSACEIEENYNRQVDPGTPGLVGYWRFDESGGTQTVADSSPAGNNGTLGNSSSAASDDPARVASTAPVSGMTTDCNLNGISDPCDISSGTSQDCNSNNLPDECEINTPTAGQAIQFDGVNDFVQVPDSPSLNLGQKVTLEFWLYQRNYGHPDTGEWLLTKSHASCSPFSVAIGVGGAFEATFTFDSGGSSAFVGSGVVPLLTWVHFV